MDRDQLLRYAGIGALVLLGIGILEAFSYDSFSYGLGHSIACNLSTLIGVGAIIGAVWLASTRLPTKTPNWLRWVVGIAVVFVAFAIIPHPNNCPSNDSADYDYR